ncbi:isoprenyl transferase [Spirochaetia bacterium]|nr:isoprenyl transferase [Spirochaetia bacterium]
MSVEVPVLKTDGLTNIPVHVGIIMDGNGRWAKKRGMARTSGHTEGLKAARRIVEAASKTGIRFLTLFVFSTENWKRASSEVDFIMGLVKQHLTREFDFYKQNKIKIRHTGDLSGLGADIIDEIEKAKSDTKDFTGMQVILALNYGGRNEIIRGFNRIAYALGQGSLKNTEITEETLAKNLDNPDVPDPDLIIRTAGEFRTSNFLLWETAYSEYYICDTLWPDFSIEDLHKAIHDYSGRERRFGAVKI